MLFASGGLFSRGDEGFAFHLCHGGRRQIRKGLHRFIGKVGNGFHGEASCRRGLIGDEAAEMEVFPVSGMQVNQRWLCPGG